MIQQMLPIWSLVPLPFLNLAWTSGCSWCVYYWSLAWRILSITLLVCDMNATVWYFEHSLALPFFGIGMKTDLLQSCGHCWVFQICWHIECSTFTASSFRIWNSSAGIPSPPLALFLVILPKALLTSHSKVNINILGISELKWTGMGEFNSDDFYIYYCGQESLRRNGVAIIVNKRVWNAVSGCNLKNDRITSVCFLNNLRCKPFNITVIQVYASTNNAQEAEVEWSCEDLQDFSELAPRKDVLLIWRTGMQKWEVEKYLE